MPIGVCDCCDGSDEFGSLFEVNCPNLCDPTSLRRSRYNYHSSRHTKIASPRDSRLGADGVSEHKTFLVTFQLCFGLILFLAVLYRYSKESMFKLFANFFKKKRYN